jgi:DNA-directed RNA polymerase subunit RPC12/RpoP
MPKKIKAIKVVKLNEKEREKFTKKYNCKRCHDFFVDTKEELEHHRELMHGEYSTLKHQQNKKGNRKLKKIYLHRNDHTKKEIVISEEETKRSKRRKKWHGDYLQYRCQNCGDVNNIYGNTKAKLQSYLHCDECGANAFKNNQQELVGLQMKNAWSLSEMISKTGIDVTKFISYKPLSKKMNTAMNGFKKRG